MAYLPFGAIPSYAAPGVGHAVAVEDDPQHVAISQEYALRDLTARHELAVADLKAADAARAAASAAADAQMAERAMQAQAARAAAQEAGKLQAQQIEAAQFARLSQAQMQAADHENSAALRRSELMNTEKALSDAVGRHTAAATSAANCHQRTENADRVAQDYLKMKREADEHRGSQYAELKIREESSRIARAASEHSSAVRQAAEVGKAEAAARAAQTKAQLGEAHHESQQREEQRALAIQEAQAAEDAVREAVQRQHDAAQRLAESEHSAQASRARLALMHEEHTAAEKQDAWATAALQHAIAENDIREQERVLADSRFLESQATLAEMDRRLADINGSTERAAEVATMERTALDQARTAEALHAEQLAAKRQEEERAVLLAQAADQSLQTARLMEATALQDHLVAKESAANAAQVAAVELTHLQDARSKEAELRSRSSVTATHAKTAGDFLSTRAQAAQQIATQRVAHDASPRRHRVTMFDAPVYAGGVSPHPPQTTYVTSLTATQAAHEAIAASPLRTRAGTLQ